MTKQELIEFLNYYFKNSQPSERFAMYRLITPVVDFANSIIKLDVFFEFKQTSPHFEPQSVDIALLTPDSTILPKIIIEAKRLNRRISHEDISKYLQKISRSIVTDGENWILILNNKNKNVNILNESGKISDSALDEIVSFIRGESINTSSWSDKKASYISKTKPKILIKEKKAVRKTNQISILETISDLNQFVKSNEKITELENSFLKSFFNRLNEGNSKSIICESRKTRISFFSENKTLRIGRIELGRNKPDLLILTKIVETDDSIENIAKSFVHDKGSHMRRFRLYEKNQSIEFGHKMAELLSEYKNI